MTSNERAGYTLLAGMTLLNVLNFADRYLLVSFGNSIIADLQLSKFQFTLLSGLVFSVFYVLFGLVAGALADRYHRPRLIAAGLALWSLLTALTGLTRNFTQAALARVFIGVGEAVLSPSALSMLSDRMPPERRGLAAAVYYLGIPIGIGSAFIFAGIMGPIFGWRGSFVALGVVGLVGALLMLLVHDPPRGGAEPLGAELLPIGSLRDSAVAMGRILRTSPVLVLVLVGSASAIFVQGAAVLDIVWWVQERGYTEVRAQQITGAIFLCGGFLGALIGGLGSDAAYRRGRGGRLMFLAVVYLLVSPIGVIYRLYATPDTALFYGLALIGSAAFMVPYGATFATVQEVVPVNLRGAAVALLILFNTLLGQAGGSAFVGYLADLFAARGMEQSLTWAIFVAGLPGLISIPAFWWAARLHARGGNNGTQT
jgi:MFS family permease